MKTMLLTCFVLFGVSLSPAWAFTTDQQEDICTTAAVIMCENFENRAVGLANATLGSAKYKNNGWGVSDTSMSIVNNQFFDGTKSLQWFYPANFTSGFFDSAFTARNEYYVRWYMKNSANWVWSANGNKMVFILGPVDRIVMFDQALFSGNTPVNIVVYPSVDPGLMYQNVGPAFHWPLDQWVCMETHLKMNSTLSSTDGLFEAWADGTQRWYYPNINLSSKDTTISHIMPSGYWNCASGQYTGGPGSCSPVDSRNNHPDMYRWIDNIVVSTQRVGCLGSTPTGGGSAPPAPTGLTVF